MYTGKHISFVAIAQFPLNGKIKHLLAYIITQNT
jgi:hypothetical protein